MYVFEGTGKGGDGGVRHMHTYYKDCSFLPVFYEQIIIYAKW